MTESVSVSVSIDESPEIYQKRLSKHTRQNLRTARNRMHTDGLDYEFRIYGTIDDASLLDELRTLHMARLRVKLNGSSTANPVRRLSSFIRKTVREHRETHNNIIYSSMQCMDNSCLVVVFLNQKIAGYLYGLRDGSIIRIMQNCVDEQYHFYSPMFRGAYDFILSCYEKGNVSAVDFTRGDEEYKYKLGGVETKLRNYVISD
jgi:CelD/BcsL family acetyltransferase involved in cellulose biosynthesis